MFKLNNKGFAITTILYGTLVLFMMLFISMMSLLSLYKSRLDILINENGGAREIIKNKKEEEVASNTSVSVSGLYLVDNKCYKYYKAGDIASCN